jgi:spermidine synthase
MNPPAPRHFAILLVLFLGSGCAALIYEIVWFQLLQLVIGSSAISLAVLLGTFMGGMCIGSLVLPRLVSSRHHPLRVYALLELGIGVAGAIVLLAVPAIGQLYNALVGHGLPGILLRAVVCSICLLPPTILMGATLPAVARWVESSPRGVSWLGLFYGGNTVGAVIGCLLAGFYLLRVHDSVTATFCAVALNVGVAAIALVLSRTQPGRGGIVGDDTTAADRLPPWFARTARGDIETAPPSRGGVLIVIGLSGFCALAAEVVWARVLSLLLGATVYTFSIILAVFLLGLGIGSTAGAAIGRRLARPRRALAFAQLLQGAAIAWAAYTIAVTLPYLTIDPVVVAAPLAKFRFDLFRCTWAILPSAVLWGASFPLALASLAAPGADPARLVGRAYAANTLGAIGGAVLCSMVLIPVLGTRYTQVALIAVSVAAAALAFRPRHAGEFAAGIAAAAAAGVLMHFVPSTPWQLVAYGRQVASTDYGARVVYFGEGMNSSVAVSETEGGARFFHVSGKTEASSIHKDMRLQRMLGHIPALLHPNPRSVLIVGCGAGVTAGTFVLHPSIERIVICDIEPLIPRVVATYFRTENHDVIRDPRVEIVHDDARHFIATTREKFDIITSDPIHPWVKGSAVLYSQEYFNLCRERLNPGGLVTQWVPLYEANRPVVQSEIATFFSVFPHGTIWANDDDGFGYDTVLLGQAGALEVHVDGLQQRLDRPDHAGVRDALKELGFGTGVDLLSTYAARFSDLRSWLAEAEINRDRNLRLQYLAGLQLDSTAGADAYLEIIGHRKFPDDVFRGEPARVKALQDALAVRLEQP